MNTDEQRYIEKDFTKSESNIFMFSNGLYQISFMNNEGVTRFILDPYKKEYYSKFFKGLNDDYIKQYPGLPQSEVLNLQRKELARNIKEYTATKF